MNSIFHLTKKTGSKKYTVAMAFANCQASAEEIFTENGHFIHGRDMSVDYGERVCSQKTWKGYLDDCPVYGSSVPQMIEGEGAPHTLPEIDLPKNTQLALL